MHKYHVQFRNGVWFFSYAATIEEIGNAFPAANITQWNEVDDCPMTTYLERFRP